MTRFVRWAVPAALVLAALCSTAAAGDAPSVRQQLIDAKGDAVVSVKFVLSMQISFQGRTMDRETSGTVTGVIVDANGLIVVPSSALSPHGGNRFGMQMDIKATPTSIRVIFPGDPKEYEAVLGATDSRIGLSFVRMKDLEGKTLKPVALDTAADVGIGTHLYGVSRLAQGFDYAPYCDDVTVVGRVKKPRKMWMIGGNFAQVGHPLFTAEGVVAGFVIHQEGVGGGASLPFLLPVGVMKSTIARAGREAEKVLEEAKEAEAEQAAEAKEGAENEKPSDTAKPDEGKKPADGEKPSGDEPGGDG